jgi:hypothetical protein
LFNATRSCSADRLIPRKRAGIPDCICHNNHI